MSIAKHLNRLTQTALAPGAAAHLASRAGELLHAVDPGDPILDVGCGFVSPLSKLGRKPVCVDIDELRVRSQGPTAAVADASSLPFTGGAFAAAFSFGLLHHLTDTAAQRAIGEVLRVVRPGGLVVIFDGVLPKRSRDRPAAALIRALDFGSHMRAETALRALFDPSWRCDRVTYAATGLEGLWCVRSR